jgi:hypothetical protein
MARDRDIDRELSDRGWRVLRIWDFDAERNLEASVARVLEALSEMTNEQEFRTAVRTLVSSGRYPEHSLLLGVRGKSITQIRSGLSSDETRWRREEVEAAGFDWESSKRAGSLIKKGRRQR